MAGVVRAALQARGVGQVVVVDDGSSDPTAEEARRAGAEVVAARPPGAARGDKARALEAGVAATRAPLLVFFDADLEGVRPEHFEGLVAPLADGETALSCGMIAYGPLRDPLFLRLPPITGLRALRRDLFEAIPAAHRRGFQIEIRINEAAVRRGAPTAMRVLEGLRHRTKLAKRGWRRGLPSHLRMVAELLGCLRSVPLWTYLVYLKNLRLLESVRPAGPSSQSREAPHPTGGPAT